MNISLLGDNFHFSFSNLNSKIESPEASTKLLKAEISGQNALLNEEKLLVKSSFGADSLDKISQKLDLGGEFKAFKN